MFSRILVPLDGTDVSEEILPTVSLLANKLKAQLLLLSVIDCRALDPREGADECGAWEAHSRERLQQLVSRLKEDGCDASALILQGIPQEEIVRTAEREDCDLIAMLSHGRNVVGWALLGSVAYNVVHLSSVPVFMLTPKKAQEFPRIFEESLIRIVAPLDGTKAAESSLPYAENLTRNLEGKL